MFKLIRDSMRRCTSFSTSKALYDLQTSFKQVFRHYAANLRTRIPTRAYDLSYEQLTFGLPNSNDSLKRLPDKPMSEAVEMNCVYIINTCEYCLEIVPSLQQSIEDQIDPEYQDAIDLANAASETFQDLIRQSINCLVTGLCARNDQIYAQTLLKKNWNEFEASGVFECQQYMKDVSKEMQARVLAIKKELNPIYFSLVLNKLASALPINFLLNVYKVKKTLSVECTQQFLYDLQNELKNLLLTLPSLDGGSAKLSEAYKQLVNTYILRVVGRFKVMGYPSDPEVIRQGYEQILD